MIGCCHSKYILYPGVDGKKQPTKYWTALSPRTHCVFKWLSRWRQPYLFCICWAARLSVLLKLSHARKQCLKIGEAKTTRLHSVWPAATRTRGLETPSPPPSWLLRALPRHLKQSVHPAVWEEPVTCLFLVSGECNMRLVWMHSSIVLRTHCGVDKQEIDHHAFHILHAHSYSPSGQYLNPKCSAKVSFLRLILLA